MWIEKRAATLNVGDLTPAGPVVGLVYVGGLRLVELDVATDAEKPETFTRTFDDIVSVFRPNPEEASA